MAGFDVIFREPALVHLESELNLLGVRGNRGFRVGIHAVHLLQDPLGVKIADIEGNLRVAHPKTEAAGGSVDKQHAGMFFHRRAEHKAPPHLGFRHGDLGPNGNAADRKGKQGVGPGHCSRFGFFRGSLCATRGSEKE